MMNSLSTSVIKAVAEEKDIDEAELSRLYNAIDPDSLDTLFRGSSGQVTFEYAGCKVAVSSQGDVEATPLATQAH